MAIPPLVYPRRQRELKALMSKLGLSHADHVDWVLLDRALTHPTAASSENYELLEFVGDAVVRLAAAALLWDEYPDWPVGEMSAVRAVLVSDRVLAQIAHGYALDRYMAMSPSAAGDREGRQSRLADALEAVAGALYLSTRSLTEVRHWLDPHFRETAAEVRADPARQNYKAALQEWTQFHYKKLPDYQVVEVSHVYGDPERFEAQVWFHEQHLGTGRGRSRKAAEQAAARKAFASLEHLLHHHPPLRSQSSLAPQTISPASDPSAAS
jgi:ribonuclease III